MDEAIERMKAFSEKEYEAIRASYLELDDAKMRQAIKEAKDYLYITPQNIQSFYFERRPGMSAEELQGEMFMFKGYEPRVLFQAKHYRHSQLGNLYAFYTGPQKRLHMLGYSDVFYMANVDGDLKIVSRYGLDFGPQDMPLTWEHADGMRIIDPGDLLEVRRFTPPQMQAHLKHYEQEDQPL